jgi:hypothetical protein
MWRWASRRRIGWNHKVDNTVKFWISKQKWMI